jgi:hypothetical protein
MVTEALGGHNSRRARRGLWLLALAGTLWSAGACSIDSKKNTLNVTDASSIGHLPTPPIGVAPGSPSPTPSSAPSTPTPQPAPSSAPPRGGCSLPPGGGNGQNCVQGNPSFMNDIEASLDAVVKANPDVFDTTLKKCDDCYKILDTQRFTDLEVQALQARGLCARFDGEEFAVKNTNDFNDQYDLITSDNYLRRGDGAYRSTCRPAAF